MLPRRKDPIVAIATATGRSGIGVVRLSGAHLAPIAHSLLGRLPAPRHAHYGAFLDETGAPMDYGIALFFPAPSSFTGEDVLELQGHGSMPLMQRLVRRCLAAGARLAQPGEFSLRAYLNGKMDLAQAEGLADLINADSEAAACAAHNTLQGAFSQRVAECRTPLTQLRVQVEAILDFPEDIATSDTARALREPITTACNLLQNLHESICQGLLLRQGVQLVLVGRPNVGKSSLLNQLVQEEAAITSATPGTTRDVLRHGFHLQGISFQIADTAGLRHEDDAADAVEREGMRRTQQEMARSDIVVEIFSAAEGITAEDRLVHENIIARQPANRILRVWNKCDVATPPPDDEGCHLSAKTGEGLAEFKQRLLQLAGYQPQAGSALFTARERHRQAITAALAHLTAALALASDQTLELLAEELRLADESLGTITGEMSSDELLGRIFSQFCIGK